MPALTATSALVGAVVLLGVWSGRWWGRRRKRALDALDAHIPVCENAGIQLVGAVGRVPEVVKHLVRIR